MVLSRILLFFCVLLFILAGGTIYSQNALPNLIVLVKQNTAELHWDHVNAERVLGFYVERLDPHTKQWKDLSWLSVNLNSKHPNYVFIDRRLKLGDYQYRLRVLDHEGKATFTIPQPAIIKEIPAEEADTNNLHHPVVTITEVNKVKMLSIGNIDEKKLGHVEIILASEGRKMEIHVERKDHIAYIPLNHLSNGKFILNFHYEGRKITEVFINK